MDQITDYALRQKDMMSRIQMQDRILFEEKEYKLKTPLHRIEVTFDSSKNNTKRTISRPHEIPHEKLVFSQHKKTMFSGAV